jgi:hypothetical protein
MRRMPNTEGLNTFRSQQKIELESKAIEAIEQLYRLNELVNFYSVARKSGVSRSFLYDNKRIVERILSLREDSTLRNQQKISLFSQTAKNSSVKLRQISARYKAVLAENRALKKEIDTLRTYIESLS